MKTILFIFYLLLSAASTCAQTTLNYYGETKTIQGEGYTYQCDLPKHKAIRLYNKENKFTYEDIVYTSTGKIFSPPLGGDHKVIVRNSEMDKRADAIVDWAFSPQEAKRVKGEELTVTMYVSPETGKVIEVDFDFDARGPYVTIPLSVYRKIEVELKKEIKFTPGEVGKQLNYIMLCWGQIPKGRKYDLSPGVSALDSTTIVFPQVF